MTTKKLLQLMTDINTELPPINDRINTFMTFVTAYLPLTEEDHLVGENSNLSEWITEMAISASWDSIPDDIVNREYNRALTAFRENGHPSTWIINAIQESAIDALKQGQLISVRISDVRKNLQLNRYIAKHAFCLRLLRDLLEVSDAHHLSST
jgi:hypothetical protein